ncbi:MAG: GatB/YqeY domain-containing protein [Rhodocyclaceae bacterium]|nr:GatB/YqeY domain-containing protein [Rhodocyclaceae bacterium]
MLLKDQIAEDMKSAMRAKDAPRLSAIRLLLAAIKQKEVDERIVMDDAAVVAVVEKALKQRRDSVAQYEAGNRPDLAEQERFEIGVLSAYMPQALSTEEVGAVIAAVVAETGAKGPADMGKVMAAVKAKLAGRADMGQVSGMVKATLTH